MHPTFEAKLEEIRKNSHVSPFLHFQDDHLCREYQKFKVSQSNKFAYIPLHLAACFFHLTGSYRGMKISFDFINVLNFVLCFIFTMFIGTWLIVVHNKEMICRKDSKLWKYLDATYTAALESVWIIGGAVCLSLVPVTLAANGLCAEGQSRVASGCNYSGDIHEVPMDITMALFFAPIIHAVVLQGASFFWVVVAIVINACVLFSVMFLYSMTFKGPIIMLFCPLCLLVMYEFQRQGISMFLLTKQQEIMMDEIERLNSESSKELRSMIGNVAHDLKTPISAFVSGLDYVYTILMEVQEDLLDGEKVRKSLQTITESVVNMKNINSFMRMSINRCIDYTKASNGMVLVPHMETVNFRDCLQLPLHCMKNLQDGRVPIELLKVSDEICDYVILDPQWFQENVLCLLSNAVKYSAEGVVTISATLVNERPTTPVGPPTPNGAPTAAAAFGSPSNGTKTFVAPAATSEPRGLEPFIRIEVEDNGIGIADELKAHLFNPFKQAQRFAGGTGLGLFSLAKRMEALGGGYGVKNKSNGKQGSVFWFSVPYRPDRSVEIGTFSHPLFSSSVASALSPIAPLVQGGEGIAAATAGRRGAGSPSLLSEGGLDGAAGKGPGLHILLVDDSISIQKMTGKMLTRMGHTVTTAENGAVALKMMSAALKSNNYESESSGLSLAPQPVFDVVLMDLQMPVMDGLEATKRLRLLESEYASKYGTTAHQLIVGVSANSDHESKGAAFDAGVDEFIPKPFNIKEFDALYVRLSKKII